MLARAMSRRRRYYEPPPRSNTALTVGVWVVAILLAANLWFVLDPLADEDEKAAPDPMPLFSPPQNRRPLFENQALTREQYDRRQEVLRALGHVK